MQCQPGDQNCMVEDRDIVQGTEIETPKALRGRSMGRGWRGYSPPHLTWGLEERCKLPQWDTEQSPARMDLVHFELERTYLTTNSIYILGMRISINFVNCII